MDWRHREIPLSVMLSIPTLMAQLECLLIIKNYIQTILCFELGIKDRGVQMTSLLDVFVWLGLLALAWPIEMGGLSNSDGLWPIVVRE